MDGQRWEKRVHRAAPSNFPEEKKSKMVPLPECIIAPEATPSCWHNGMDQGHGHTHTALAPPTEPHPRGRHVFCHDCRGHHVCCHCPKGRHICCHGPRRHHTCCHFLRECHICCPCPKECHVCCHSLRGLAQHARCAVTVCTAHARESRHPLPCASVHQGCRQSQSPQVFPKMFLCGKRHTNGTHKCSSPILCVAFLPNPRGVNFLFGRIPSGVGIMTVPVFEMMSRKTSLGIVISGGQLVPQQNQKTCVIRKVRRTPSGMS